MKNSLTDLLYEEYKQSCLFDELEKRGIDMSNITVNNFRIVLDLIGFPRDNTDDYDFDVLNGLPHNPNNGKKPDDNMFCDDWLWGEYVDALHSIDKVQKIVVTDKGLKIIEEDDEMYVKSKLREFIEWLYEEYARIKK